MKVFTALLIAAALIFTAASCGENPKSPYHNEEAVSDVKMSTQFSAYRSDFEKIQVTLENKSGDTLELGSDYSLEMLVGETWRTVPFKENAGFDALLRFIDDGGTYSFAVSKNMFDHEFSVGSYRVIKELDDGRFVSAEFEISEAGIGADAPYGYADIKSLPGDYGMEDAAADGCITVGNITDDAAARLDKFFTEVRSRVDSQIRIYRQTDEGTVIYDLLYEEVVGDRFCYTVDETRVGGELEVQYFGAMVSDGEELYLSNRIAYDPDDVFLTEFVSDVEWSGKSAAAKDFASISEWNRDYRHFVGVYWSADGTRMIDTVYGDPYEFGVTVLYEGGGNSGCMNSLPRDLGITAVHYVLWQDESNALFVCDTADPEIRLAVLYDTSGYSVVSITEVPA